VEYLKAIGPDLHQHQDKFIETVYDPARRKPTVRFVVPAPDFEKQMEPVYQAVSKWTEIARSISLEEFIDICLPRYDTFSISERHDVRGKAAGILEKLVNLWGDLETELRALRDRDLAVSSAPVLEDAEGPAVGAGYLYLLVNRSMPGLVKIGKTTREPGERMRELGGVTGVPTPFELVFKVFVDDCSAAERLVHERLERHRVSTRREFFDVSTDEAIHAMVDAQRQTRGAAREAEREV
jgi:hypothetical protein